MMAGRSARENEGMELEEPGNPYVGTTTNERLFMAGLLDQFDKAAKRRERAELIKLLRQTFITEAHAERIADTLLQNPEQYGY